MNATIVASETKAVPPVVSSIQDIPLATILESRSNPRRLFDEVKLAELADSVPGNRIGLCGKTRYVAFGLLHSRDQPGSPPAWRRSSSRSDNCFCSSTISFFLSTMAWRWASIFLRVTFSRIAFCGLGS